MERTEIIKALEYCSQAAINLAPCDRCPFIPKKASKGSLGCNDELMQKALAFIKEQQKELTFCYDKLTELEKECLGLSLHNITLKKEKKYLRESLADERKHKEDMEGNNAYT